MAGSAVRADDDVFRVVRAVHARRDHRALLWKAVPAFQKFGFRFFYTDVWDPVKLNFGALAPIYGTLVTSAIALVIGVPVSFGIALVSHRDVPRFS
jgi:phosphate transport system permease protein